MYGLTRRLLVTVTSKREVVKGIPIARQLSSNESGSGIHIPDYKVTGDESADVKRARLLYQSRKRGMLENDLLLGTFVDKYLFEMNNELLSQYDRLINCPYSDWDIYYWALGSRPTPPEYDNEIMSLLKEHVKNSSKERRLRQPDLPKKVLNK